MCKVYGYVRVSTAKQNPERQAANIKAIAPEACIISETYTGTTTDRPAWNKLRKAVKPGDTIIFDEVSRMSRNAAEGVELYMELYAEGVELIFVKEPHINTATYKAKLEAQAAKLEATTGSAATDKLLSAIMGALTDYVKDLAAEQIRLAFDKAQSEVDFLHRRTAEGVQRAIAEGKQVGRAAGAEIHTRKEREAVEIIRKHSRDFGGTLSDPECMKLAGVSRNSYYKYKKLVKTIDSCD